MGERVPQLEYMEVDDIDSDKEVEIKTMGNMLTYIINFLKRISHNLHGS